VTRTGNALCRCACGAAYARCCLRHTGRLSGERRPQAGATHDRQSERPRVRRPHSCRPDGDICAAAAAQMRGAPCTVIDQAPGLTSTSALTNVGPEVKHVNDPVVVPRTACCTNVLQVAGTPRDDLKLYVESASLVRSGVCGGKAIIHVKGAEYLLSEAVHPTRTAPHSRNWSAASNGWSGTLNPRLSASTC